MSFVGRCLSFILFLPIATDKVQPMEKQHLFDQFSPVSATQWKEKIVQDLKGIPYGKLITNLDEGFEIQPFYQKEDLASLGFLAGLPGQFPFVRGKNSDENHWQVNQVFPVKHPGETNREILKALKNGVDALTFVFDETLQPEPTVLQQLLQNVDMEKVSFHFRKTDTVAVVNSLQSLVSHPEKLKGSVENDPLSCYNFRGVFKEKEPFDQMAKAMKITSGWPSFRVITVDGTVFHNAGGTTVSEMAFALAMGSFYMQQLTENGFSPDEVADKILFRLAIGSDYFMEIAKFRAFRYLWAQILKAFGVSPEKAAACIQAENSYRNKTVYDPYVNMLRTTTETMSAILGGVDVVTVLPFDTTFEIPSEMAKRVARNQQLILKEESYFGKVADPAAGSYYIENLTANLVEKSWALFLEVDEQGGYPEAFRKGFVQDRIEAEARKKNADIARRKTSVLGVNQFPNQAEYFDNELDTLVFDSETSSRNKKIRPLHVYRAAAAFEKLRYTTDRFAKIQSRPRVWLLTLGDPAMRRARAKFAENFFGCAGYEIMDHTGFASAADGITSAMKDNPDIVVLCGDDKTYEEVAMKVFDALKDKTIVVLAGHPQPLVEKLKAKGMEHFIHVRSNVMEELQQFQKELGINL